MRWLFYFVVLLSLSSAQAQGNKISFVADKITWPYQIRIQKVLDTMPARGKTHDVSIRVVPEKRWPRSERWAAAYCDSNSITHKSAISLRRSEYYDCVVAHEFGHHVYFTDFTHEERLEWCKFWAGAMDDMPSDYACTSPEEGFAECYMVTFFQGDLWANTTELTPQIKAKVLSYFKPKLDNSEIPTD